MKKLFFALCVGLLSGCSGGGGGGGSTSDSYTFTKYHGFSKDARFGKNEFDINLIQTQSRPGYVTVYYVLQQYDSSDKVVSYHQFNYFGATKELDSDLVPFTNQTFSSPMGTWPESVPDYELERAVCHMNVEGAVSPDLQPGSTLVMKYSSKDCSFVTAGTVSASFVNTQVYAKGVSVRYVP